MKKTIIFSVISYVLTIVFLVFLGLAIVDLSRSSGIATGIMFIVYLIDLGAAFFICLVFAIIALEVSKKNCKKGFKIANIIQLAIYWIIAILFIITFISPVKIVDMFR